MADSSLLMPAADEAYRRSRDRLRAAEIDLRDRIEAVAAMRREPAAGAGRPRLHVHRERQSRPLIGAVCRRQAVLDRLPFDVLGEGRFVLPDVLDVDRRIQRHSAARHAAGELRHCIPSPDRSTPRVGQRTASGIACACSPTTDRPSRETSTPRMPRAIPIRRSSSSRKRATACVTFTPRTRCWRTASAGSTCSVRRGIFSISRRPVAVTGTRRTMASTPRCARSRARPDAETPGNRAPLVHIEW